MADNSNNIDKLFREKLQGHKVAAPSDGWSRLEEALHKPASRRMLWIIRTAAAAVLLMLAFGAGIFWSDYYRDSSLRTQADPSAVIIDNNHDNSKIDNEIIDDPITSANSFENISSPRTTYNSGAVRSDALPGDSENDFVIKSTERHSPTKSSLYSLVPLKVELSGKNVIITPFRSALKHPAMMPASATEHYAFIFENNQLTADDPLMMDDEMLRRLLLGEDAFADQDQATEEIAAPKGWSIGGQLSPVYSYRTLSGDVYVTPDEKVDAGYFNDMESGIVSVGGGISMDYQLGERFSIASGLYLSRIGQQNESVLAYNDPDGYGMYKLASSTGSVSVNPAQFTQVLATQPASAKDIPGDYVASSTFIQNLDYLEVPLVLKYRLLDTRFGINLLGGISPGILVNNHSYFEFEGQKLQTGTTENIQPMIYNSVLGIGMEYAINKKISVNLAPSFKYSLTPVNTSNNLGYHPYSLSWFTGVSYKLY
ncbi:MAG: PorT family protein [Clostridia bacterium]|nr:PorT family protein [Clostridia bacterium]